MNQFSEGKELILNDFTVGVIRGQWLNRKNDRVTSVCYGTGVAISPRIILTCAHTVYSQSKGASKLFSFIPNVQQGKITKKNRIFRNSKQSFFKMQTTQKGKKFTKQTVEDDIALLFLQKPLEYKQYPKIGCPNIRKDKQITVIGYPSENYANVGDINEAYYKRVAVRGNILDIEDTIIYHNLDTKTGHSGGPIMALSDDETPTIIGVHTHKGNIRNFGVFLNEKVIKKLIKYQIEFAKVHQDYRLSILFPKNLRLQVLSQQLQEDREAVLPAQELIDIEKVINNRKCINFSNNYQFQTSLLIKLTDQQYYKQFSNISLSRDVLSDEQIALGRSYNKFKELNYQNSRLAKQKAIPEERYSLYQSYLKHNGRILEIIQKMIESAISKIRIGREEVIRTMQNNYNQINQSFNALQKKLQKYIGNPIPQFNLEYQSSKKICSVQQHLKKINRIEKFSRQIFENSMDSEIQDFYQKNDKGEVQFIYQQDNQSFQKVQQQEIQNIDPQSA